jgi:hypothetical protein
MLKIKQDPEKLQKTKKILRDSISRGKKLKQSKKTGAVLTGEKKKAEQKERAKKFHKSALECISSRSIFGERSTGQIHHILAW